MADIQATLFRFQQFVLEFGPFFLAAWLGIALATGLAALTSRQRPGIELPGVFRRIMPLAWLYQAKDFLLPRPIGEESSRANLGAPLIFGIIVSVPALVVTSLIDMETVYFRLATSALFALSLGWLVTTAISRRQGKSQGQRPQVEAVSRCLVSHGDSSTSRNGVLRCFARDTWKSFSGQVNKAALPIIIGFGVSSALTIYVPAYEIRPWLGEGVWQGPYLAALLAMPFQLAGGAEVLLASALLVKGASLGAALSVMLAAPSATIVVLRGIYRSTSFKAVPFYLVAVWIVAGSLGVVANVVKGLFDG